MTDDEVLEQIDNDLRDSGGKKVLYLEGHTDVAPLFALLGQPQTTDAVFDGILVRGLGGHAGSKTVKRYLKIAQEHTHLRRRIFGVVDGDGRLLDELNTTFDGGGPSFDWPTYCIENLLAQVERGWPAAWGDPPDWSDELGRLAPLAAINRLIKTFGDELRAAQLREFWKTSYPRPLATADEIDRAARTSADEHQSLSAHPQFPSRAGRASSVNPALHSGGAHADQREVAAQAARPRTLARRLRGRLPQGVVPGGARGGRAPCGARVVGAGGGVRRWAWWVALVAIAAGCAGPPAYTARERAPEAPAASVAVRAMLPVVKAEVSGQPVELVWDLGSAHALSLPAHVLKRVGARETGEVVRFEDAGGHPLEARVFEVERLVWGGVTWRGVRAVEAVWSEAHAPPLELGVLGRPLFEGMRLVVRLGAGEVAVEPSAGCSAGAVELGRDHGLMVEVELGGERVAALLDTAATANITTTKHLQGAQRLTINDVYLGEVELSYAPLRGLPTEVSLGMPFWLTHEAVLELGAGCAWFAPARP